MALKRLKNAKNTVTERGAQFKGDVSGTVLKPNANFRKTYAMKTRIRALEAEVEKLRSTVKFYQEMYLQDD
jgi:hypothetical protein